MHDIEIDEKILSRNEALARENREALKGRGIFSINVVSSPGSGKTTIIEKTVELLRDRVGMAVIEGDMQTDLDAQRIARYNIPVRQITTGKACHLDAHMVHHTLPWVFGQGKVQLLIFENVGNMVCPAEYDLGEDMKVAVMSVPEGDDKPLKYPTLFHAAKVLIINKTDLVRFTNFDLQRAEENALKINPRLTVFKMSCADGTGLREWADFLAAHSMK
ncbi:MAG: hydrogenase nickel incorporation protein HypB [Alphaproteobacteria bacterium]|uniref:Hydrogenase nickel incorporation protein HypB n=1 Tax=Candidatus Nitrobium versatile TaxID=2884831 RepID=A0A953JA33_9BACT|nr:hydrogenase nickel incorporation protein HypB [Candidatus Nitrobium versatile]